jgi:hypothetical protein
MLQRARKAAAAVTSAEEGGECTHMYGVMEGGVELAEVGVTIHYSNIVCLYSQCTNHPLLRI